MDGNEYLAVAQTEAAAVRKALAEERERNNHGQQLRLGQGITEVKFCRSHRREMKSWIKENKKVLM